MNKISSSGLLAAVAAGLIGCTTTPTTIVQQPTMVRPQQAAAPAVPNGAIFQTSSYRPMFEDRRARLVGDVITIAINEKTSAGKSSATSGSKDGSTSSSISKLFSVPASTLANIGAGASTANKFEEKGAASSSNNFTGIITATVSDVLPNGNLVVVGEKQVAFDKGVEYVRFSGVVNPDTIAAGNVVPSTQVADARIEYRTNSRIDHAEFMSQIARFFFSLAPL
ncbi:flagellar basal body L-ring protein FlgH [Noviherbaspirillum massiliense]|uniref:flagellar basal body L-ring protein FlgH n=1 Tax=Noviherbaspirillum massiliense TaxID=1465823 RepID=UPI0002D8FDDB|nr:flagellar basal body L-ring protein FlgH [Noviherbaspirillum massiliense]